MSGALTLDSLVPYLLGRDLLSTRDVVDSPLEIRDYSRRNRSFKVIAPEGESLLVKQAGSLADPEFRASLAHEAAILRAVATEPALAPARPFVPRFVAFDADASVLATELVHPATSITKYHLNRGAPRFPDDAATSCARILADVHAHGARALASGALEVPHRAPFIWDAFRAPDKLPVGAYRLWLEIRERAAFWSRLDELRQAWDAADGLAHMDVRWDNFLLSHGAGPRGMLNLRLIDWELAGRGDPAWDVACYLSEYPRFAFAQPGVRPEAMHASARLFWGTYVKRAKASGADLLRRVHAFLPFALVVVATELVQKSERVTPTARRALDVAIGFADSPEATMREWFGFPEAP